jgi:multiple sugar transport system ATP-binding protein
MTLGDRVVVMHGGIAQQIGTPEELYERPANLFVAGFIGSPAMNFFPAELIPTGLRLSFGEVTLTPEARERIDRHPKPGSIIVGVRPEHLSDAALIDGYQRIRALTFEVKVELVESLGADKYVYFTTTGPAVQSVQLDELEAEGEVRENHFVARVPAESKAAIGGSIELAFDTAKLTVFDADSGVNLTASAPSATG